MSTAAGEHTTKDQENVIIGIIKFPSSNIVSGTKLARLGSFHPMVFLAVIVARKSDLLFSLRYVIRIVPSGILITLSHLLPWPFSNSGSLATLNSRQS